MSEDSSGGLRRLTADQRGLTGAFAKWMTLMLGVVVTLTVLVYAAGWWFL